MILALIAAVVVWLILYRSQWGYEIRLIGDNPARGRVRGDFDRAQYRAGDDAFRRPGRAGGHVGDHRRGAPAARFHLTGLRLHRDHRGLAGQTEPIRGDPGLDFVWRVDPGRARNPTFRDPQDDPGDHPGLPDRQRFLDALPHPHCPPRRRRSKHGPAHHSPGRRRDRNHPAFCHPGRNLCRTFRGDEPGRGRDDADWRDERFQHGHRHRQSLVGTAGWRCWRPG